MDRETLLLRLGEQLSPEVLEDLRAYLESNDNAGPDDTWLHEVLRAIEALPLSQVPPVVSQDLRDLFDETALLHSHRAVLVTDTRRDRMFVGVRGNSPNDGWSLTYSCEVADILLDVWPAVSGVDVEGQVMTHGGRALAYRASVDGPVTQHADSDQLGRFRFESLAEGSYDLVVSNRRVQIALPLVLLVDTL